MVRLKNLNYVKIYNYVFNNSRNYGVDSNHFRGAGMLVHGMMVKYLVSIGNLFWFINGAMTKNTPLMVSNGFCLVVMLYEMIKTHYKK